MTKSFPPPVARAFTLIEMLVIMAIILLLAAILIPSLNSALVRAKATKDMSNLRQIGMATQVYMNDSDGVFPGSATATWASQLELNRKYLSVWRILESPFDKRTTSELGDGTTAISYGINSNTYVANVPISADKITKPTVFIVFAPAQTSSATTVSFGGWGNSSAPGVSVLAAASTPGGTATGGTHQNRTKINAMCGDWHVEMMPWSGTGPAFTNTTATGTDPDGAFRWSP